MSPTAHLDCSSVYVTLSTSGGRGLGPGDTDFLISVIEVIT